MKKALISLFVVQTIFVAAFACAEGVDQAKLAGTWERFDVDIEKLGEDIPAGMQAIEAGEKKIEDVMEEWGTGSYPGDAQTMELLESGELTIVASMADTLDFENDLEAYVFFTLKGTWSLDGEKLKSEAASTEKMEISTAHLTEEQQKQFEGEVADMQADMDEEKAEFEQQALKHFGLIAGDIVYFGEKCMLLKTEDDDYMIFQKK